MLQRKCLCQIYFFLIYSNLLRVASFFVCIARLVVSFTLLHIQTVQKKWFCNLYSGCWCYSNTFPNFLVKNFRKSNFMSKKYTILSMWPFLKFRKCTMSLHHTKGSIFFSDIQVFISFTVQLRTGKRCLQSIKY